MISITWTPGKHRPEEVFRKRISGYEHLPRPLSLDLEPFRAVCGEHQLEAILTRRKAVRRRKPVIAVHRRRFQMRRDRQRDGWKWRLAHDKPVRVFCKAQDDVATWVSRKLASEGLDITCDSGPEFVEEPPTIKTDELSLSSGRLLIPDAHCVALALVIDDPLDPLRRHNRRSHCHLQFTPGDSVSRCRLDWSASVTVLAVI